MAINPFKRRFLTPGFAGGTLEDQLARDVAIYGAPRHGTMEVRTGELEGFAPPPLQEPAPRKYYHDIGEVPVHTKPGGLDMYSDVNRKQGERPIDAIRREGTQRAAIGLGDPVIPGSATFATNTELAGPDRRLSLDYVPTGERTRPRTALPSFRQAFNRKPPVLETAPTFNGQPILAEQVNGEPFGTRDRRTQPRDYVADNAQYIRDLQNEPRGWKDTALDVIDAVSAGFGNKPRPTMSARERKLARAQEQLGMDMALEKQAQNDLVPVTLDNGQTVMAPARSAAAIASRQQEIALRGDTLGARKKRWDTLGINERRREIGAMYRAGAFNTPEGLEYAARELGIPVALMPKFLSGLMRDAINDEGNIIEINRQTGAVTPTGEKSYETVKEAGRDRRVQMSQEGQDRRKAMTPPRTGRGQIIDKTAQRRAATLIGQIDRARREIVLADDALQRNPNDTNAKKAREHAQSVGEQAASELNALNAGYEAGPGEKGYPYYKQKNGAPQSQGGKYAGRRISQAKVPEFARRHGMSEDEAVQFLKSEGAVVY